MNYEVRAKGALYGLAIGDAVGWPALYHRTYTLPFWTRRLRREIDAAHTALILFLSGPAACAGRLTLPRRIKGCFVFPCPFP